ncbi:MAG: hypothetical protein R6W79_08470 [Acidimicrobiia bacterium]
MTRITALRLPIDWTAFGWPDEPAFDGIAMATGDPQWAWDPAAPAFPIHTMTSIDGTTVEGFSVDHVVILVPDLQAAIATLGRTGIEPRLQMTIPSGRQAAFFRVGTVLEVIEAPVRQASLYGIALTTDDSLEALSIRWRALGLSVGDILPAFQPGRRIMTIHDVDAGFAVMSRDGATRAP